MHTTLIDMRII